MRRHRSSYGKPRQRHPVFWLAFVCAVLCLGWFLYVFHRIEAVASHDDAQRADAIAVFGAAQYRGHPSPVYHARLDHAVSLYQRQIAPVVITLGGSVDDHSTQTEGSVGRDYLLARGVPFNHIIAETESVDTEQQVGRLAEMARERGFRSVVAVSDPTHLFRIAELCRSEGLPVFTSPRSSFGNISRWERAQRIAHEVLSYTSLRLHLQGSFLHRWLEGKEEL